MFPGKPRSFFPDNYQNSATCCHRCPCHGHLPFLPGRKSQKSKNALYSDKPSFSGIFPKRVLCHLRYNRERWYGGQGMSSLFRVQYPRSQKKNPDLFSILYEN